MMIPELNSVAITDFRSIRGSITIPFDAPVVLLHGPNGAGKTSILSALELALTGEILAMRRTDSNYKSHLKHREAPLGRIALTSSGISGMESRTHELLLQNGTVTGEPVLSQSMSRFFSE